MANNSNSSSAASTVRGNIIIDQRGENQYTASEMHDDLCGLKQLITELALVSKDDSCISIARYEDNLLVLNWLINDVELVDI